MSLLLTPDNKEALKGLVLSASSPIDYVSIRLYTRKSDPIISNKNQLKGKVVGHLRSVGEAMLDAENETVQNVPHEEQLLKMLFANRLDILMGHHPDIPMAIKRLGLDEVHFDPAMTVYSTSVHFVCHDFIGAHELLGKINLRIKESRASGLAQEILGEHAKVVPLSDDSKLNM